MQDIHGIRPPVPVGFDPMLLKIMVTVLGGIILLTLLFFLVRKYWKKRNRPKGLKYLPEPMAPYEAAIKELDLLSQMQILDPRLFYFDLTAVFKKYISRSFEINAMEMTSQEFVKAVNRLDLDKGIKKNTARFQELSDSFKYAGIFPEIGRIDGDLLFVREMVDQIENSRIKDKDKEDKGDGS